MKNNNNTTKTKRTKMLQAGVVMSCCALFLLAFAVDNVHAEFINCPTSVDLDKYPICKFKNEWNESERFNALVVQKVGDKADSINDMARSIDDMAAAGEDLDPETVESMKATYLLDKFADARIQVARENLGMLEQSTALKEQICTATGICY